MKHPSILYIDQTTKNLQQNENVFASYLNALQNHPCGPLKDTLRHRIFWATRHCIPYCKRSSCHRCGLKKRAAKASEIKRTGLHNHVYKSAITLPLYGLSKANRNEAINSFLRWLRKTFGSLTYFRGTERANSFWHCHFILYSLGAIDYDEIAKRWLKEINRRIANPKSSFEGQAEEVYDEDGWVDYITKNYGHYHHHSIPSASMCRVPLRKANNWKKFWNDVHKMCDENAEKNSDVLEINPIKKCGPVASIWNAPNGLPCPNEPENNCNSEYIFKFGRYIYRPDNYLIRSIHGKRYRNSQFDLPSENNHRKMAGKIQTREPKSIKRRRIANRLGPGFDLGGGSDDETPQARPPPES